MSSKYFGMSIRLWSPLVCCINEEGGPVTKILIFLWHSSHKLSFGYLLRWGKWQRNTTTKSRLMKSVNGIPLSCNSFVVLCRSSFRSHDCRFLHCCELCRPWCTENVDDKFCLKIVWGYALGQLDIPGDRSLNKICWSTFSLVRPSSAAIPRLWNNVNFRFSNERWNMYASAYLIMWSL